MAPTDIPASFIAARAEALARRKQILACQRAIKAATTPADRQTAEAALGTLLASFETADAADLAAIEERRSR